MRVRRAYLPLTLLAALSVLSFAVALAAGSVGLTAGELAGGVAGYLTGGETSLASTLVALRVERAAAAWLTGALLASAGVMMQALLRNPLADPYVLGLSGGASVGALGALMAGLAGALVDLAAFAGALAVTALLFALARDGVARGARATLLLLTGVIIGAGCGALVTLMLALAPDENLRGMVFWLIGDLSGSGPGALPALALAAALLFCLARARSINLMALYGDNALTLGVDVARLRAGLFALSALLTASAVSMAGSIGFVGLIVPHACRLALGPDHRVLLPSAALAGGALLVLADTVARTAFAPLQLPVGVITALIGVPAFLWQLRRSQESAL